MYEESVRRPELLLKAQIPSNFGLSTLPLSRHITVTATANASGNLFFAWQPYCFTDNTSTQSTLAINNNVAVDGIGGGAGFALIAATPYTMPAGTIQSYSLVSASMIVQPQSNWSSITGKIGGCSVPLASYQTTPGSPVLAVAATQTFSNIELMTHYAECDMQRSESLRFLYTVNDIHDFEKYTINTDGLSSEAETTFIGFVVGAPANCKFNIELYINFEVTVIPGSALSGLATPCTSMVDPKIIHNLLVSMPGVIVSPLKGSVSSMAYAPSGGTTEIAKIAAKQNHTNHDYASKNYQDYFRTKTGHDITARHRNDKGIETDQFHSYEMDNIYDEFNQLFK